MCGAPVLAQQSRLGGDALTPGLVQNQAESIPVAVQGLDVLLGQDPRQRIGRAAHEPETFPELFLHGRERFPAEVEGAHRNAPSASTTVEPESSTPITRKGWPSMP